jgi:hypothetical protein
VSRMSPPDVDVGPRISSSSHVALRTGGLRRSLRSAAHPERQAGEALGISCYRHWTGVLGLVRLKWLLVLLRLLSTRNWGSNAATLHDAHSRRKGIQAVLSTGCDRLELWRLRQAMDIDDDVVLKGVDQVTYRSLNGPRTTNMILRLIPEQSRESFLQVLRIVRCDGQALCSSSLSTHVARCSRAKYERHFSPHDCHCKK